MVDYHLVYALIGVVIGLVISLAMGEIRRHIDIVLSCRENRESLKAKVENLETIIRQLREHLLELNIPALISTELAVMEWFKKLENLNDGTSEMLRNCRIPRVNIISRYKTSNEITTKISDMDKHLKLVPLIQLELLLFQLNVMPSTRIVPVSIVGLAVLQGVLHGGRGWVINQILRHIKIVLCYNTELESLRDLVRSIRPIFSRIWQIQSDRISTISKPEAINVWLPEMRQLLERADKIECIPWWKVICRYEKSKQMTRLISHINAHVKLASVISLEPIFQNTEEVERLLQLERRRHNSASSSTFTEQNEPEPEEEAEEVSEESSEEEEEEGGSEEEDLGEREPLLGRTSGNLHDGDGEFRLDVESES